MGGLSRGYGLLGGLAFALGGSGVFLGALQRVKRRSERLGLFVPVQLRLGVLNRWLLLQ